MTLLRCSSFALIAISISVSTTVEERRLGAADDIMFRVVMVEDQKEDPAAAGKSAATALLEAMDGAPLKAVIVSECFEDREYKEQLLSGINSVLPPEVVMGGATYGSFTQDGCTDFDAVCLLGLGGEGLMVSKNLVTDMGTSQLALEEHEELIAERLRRAGKQLAAGLTRHPTNRLLILIADAHSPKNQYLVEGVQQVVGKDFPITGGCANKNAGQTFVYYGGKSYEDSAVALLLSGDFQVSLSGRQANLGDEVVRTAREGARDALAAAAGRPIAVMAFNCAGRRSKLQRYEDELAATQEALGKQLPLFGCYCAGEMGPIDDEETSPDAFCGGSGWHVMFTVVSR
jgi:hypothetical protein